MIKRYLLLPLITILIATSAYAQTTITGATGNYPTAASLDADANIYIVQYDSGNNEYDVVKYTAASGYSTSSVIYNGLYFNGEYPTDIEVASNGDVYVLDGFDEPASTGAVLRLDASNAYSSSSITLVGSHPVALGIDGNDNIYVSEYGSVSDDYRVVRYTAASGYSTSSVIYNGLGLDTYPRGLTADSDGNVYALTSFGKDAANGQILKIIPSIGPTIVDQGDYYTGLAINGNGDLFATAYNGGADNFSIVKYTGGAGAPTSVISGLTYSGSSFPTGLGSNLALGDIVIPDPWNASNGSLTYIDLEDPVQAPTVATSLVNSITATGATLSGNVTDDGGGTVTERGFVYSLTADDSTPTVAESSGSDVTKVVVSGTTGVFNETISGLSASSQYSLAAYAINSVGTSYGSVEQFSTVNNPISEYSSGTNTLPETRFFGIQFTTPNTDPAYSMTGFTFLNNTGSNPAGAGKVYVFTSSPSGLLTPSDLPTYTEALLGISDSWNGSVYGFSGGLNLDANTTYWVLTDTDGFEVGNDFSNPNNAIYAISSGNNYVNQLQRINYQVTGIAVSAPPTVTTTAASGITATGATLSGNVNDDGGDTVTERGFVYATTSGPTTSDTKIQDGTGTGAFEEAITGLSAETTYYVRAYAINGAGTSYGSEQSFTTLSIFAGGAGTEADPYQVETAEQLDQVRNFLGSHFILKADIDLGVSPWNVVGDGWEPIGEWNDMGIKTPFTGSLDGDGHIISNLYIDNNMGDVGLFSYLTGVVQNIGLENVDVTGGFNSGTLVGNHSGTINRVYVTGSVKSPQCAGGIVGRAYSSITDSYAHVNVVSEGNYAGGVACLNNGTISTTYSTGSVTGDSNVGGLVGLNSSTVSDSFWDTEASGNASSDGGTGITTTAMKTKATFTGAGWDFDTVWQIDEPGSGSISYPYLQNNTQDPVPGYEVNSLPIASNVTISGSLTFEQILTGAYDYSDDDGDAEGATTFQWYRSDDGAGTNRSAISGATNLTYTLAQADVGKYISFEVTPNDGTEFGSSVESILQGPVTSPFAGGEGTEVNPWQIATAEHLDYVRAFLDSHFIQTADIDLGVSPWNVDSGWEPIGGNGNTFTGTFDGQGHTISGLFINRSTDYVGLFGYINTGSIIQNLGLIDVSIRGSNTVGGLVGYLLDGTVSNSYVFGKVNQNTNSGDDIGGLAGRSAGTITDSYVDVIVGGSSRVGGLVGRNEGAIKGSYALGTLLGSNRLGGFVGSNEGTGTISNSYSSVDVSSNQFNQNIFGGLVGQNSGAISNSYANGIMVVNQNSAGGLVGTGSGSATGSFWDTETTGQLSSAGGTGKTTVEMKTRSTFTDAGWSFDSVWEIVETSTSISNPYLQNNTQDPAPGYERNNLPVASNVTISGSLIFDQKLTGVYDYSDSDGDAEGATTYQWYRSDDDQGTGKVAITGAASISYTTTGDDVGKFVSFEVTPSDGIEFGSAVESTLQGPVYTVPELATSAASGIEALEATLNAEVTTDNFDAVSDRGFVYGLTATPTLAADRVLTAGNGVGTYSALTQDLLPNRIYFVRSYATNSAGTVYGNEVNFTTGKKELTIAGSFTALDKEYDGTTKVTTSENTLEVTGLEGTDQANLASVELHFAQADTGTAITATVANPVLEGPDAENYTITADGAPTSSASILPKELIIGGTFTIAEKRYDGTTGAVLDDNSLSLDGVVGAETVTLDGIELSFPQTDAGTGLTVSLSGPVIGGVDASNYTATADGSSTFTADLLPYVLSLSDFTADNKEYDGTAGVSRTGFSDDRFDGDQIDFSYDAVFENPQAGTGINVNYTNITVSGGMDQNNYTLASSIGTTTADIGQRPVSLVANAASKVYGEVDPQFTYELTSGSIIGSDTFNGSLDRTGDESVGVYTISQGSLSAGDNYSVAFTSADFEITQKALAIVASSDQTKVYGDADPVLTFTASGFEFAEDELILTGMLDRATGEDAGTYSIGSGSLDAGSNYGISFTSADFEITPRPVTLTNFTANNKTYDGTTDVTGTGFDDDRLGGNDLTFDYDAAFADADAVSGKDVHFTTITISGGADELNYDLQTTSSTAAADIAQRPVAITADAQQVVYGEADPVLTYQITAGSLVTGEQLSGDLARASGQDVGIYAIQQGSLTAGDNYDITYQGADFEITQQILAITANADQAKTYGDTDPAFTFEATNFGWSDDETILTGALDRQVGEAAGQYTITQGDLSAGDNYTIDFTSDTFSITARELLIEAVAGQSKVYGENDPQLSYTATGFEAGDDESLLSDTLDRAIGEDAGTYSIGSGSLDAGSNYAISFTSVDFEITPRPVTLINFTADDKTYDGSTDVTGTGFDDDRIEGDELVFTYSAAFEDKNNDVGKTVNYTDISISGGTDQNNYSLAASSASVYADIMPKTVSIIDVIAENKVYDGTTEAVLAEQGIISGLAEGETLTLAGPENVNFEDENVGTGKHVIASGYRIEDGISGGLASNYLLDTDEVAVTADILKKHLSVIVRNDEKVVDDEPYSGGNGIIFNGFINGENEGILEGSLMYSGNAQGALSPGSYTIEVSGFTSPNYDIEYVDGILTILSIPAAQNPFPVEGSDRISIETSIFVGFDQEVTALDLSRIQIRYHHQSGQEEAVESVTGSAADNILTVSHPGLNFDTEYTVSIPEGVVENADQVGNERFEWSFTTMISPPAKVKLAAPADNEGRVDRMPQFSWQVSGDVETFHIQVAPDQDFKNPVIDQDDIREPAYATGLRLDYHKQYYWRVRSHNYSGISEWSDISAFGTIAETPLTVFPVHESENISTAPDIQWSSDHENTRYRLHLAGTDDFSEIMADTLVNEELIRLTGLADDEVYYWRVKVESDLTESEWSQINTFRTRLDPVSGDDQIVSVGIEFGDTATANRRELTELDYRLIGFPGRDAYKLDQFFEGKYGTEWRAFVDNGNDFDYYDEYTPEDNRFRFTPGNGFWVLSTDELDFELAINNVEINERDGYDIDLQPGWNIISNPHRGPVSWTDVLELNDFQADLYEYDERFVLADTLQPVQGYYFYNNPHDPLNSINIPYSSMQKRRSIESNRSALNAAVEVLPSQASLKAVFNGDTELKVDLIFTNQTGGILKEDFNWRRHYPSLELSKMGMMMIDEDVERGGLIRDEVFYSETGQEYQLKLKSEVGRRFIWSAELSGLPGQARMLLINPVTNQSWMLADGESVEMTVSEPVATYRMYVGDQQWLEGHQEELLPQDIVLEQNYPNPFNPVTNIRYSIPNQQNVRLEIYDVIGRRVQILQNGVQQPGWHLVQFDANNLSSGLYFYRLQTNNSMKTGSMMLVK